MSEITRTVAINREMMEIKIGDKVRFLNAVGGGEVVRYISKGLVAVLDEDGFETPVQVRECVLIESANKSVQTAVKSSQTPSTRDFFTQPPVSVEKEIAPIETPEGEVLNVYLAYLPVDRIHIQECAYECYLLNDSNYYLSVNIMSKREKGWTSRYCGVIEPNIKAFIEEVDKSHLNEIERLTVQFIAFKQGKPFAQKNAISVDLKIDTVKFYKLHSFRENDFFDEEALIFPLVEKDVACHQLAISHAEIQSAMNSKESPAPQQPIARKRIEKPIIEVDLHVNQLLDTTNGMENAELLNYQLDKFREVMEANKMKKGQKIVFIHGKGEGVLRTAILKELKSKYKECFVQDASFREYGFGATQVTIH